MASTRIFFVLLLRLRELIVIDTQWVVDGISRIIRDFEIHQFEVDKLAIRHASDQFRKLKDNGVLYHDLLQHLWSEPKFAQQQAVLIKLQLCQSSDLPPLPPLPNILHGGHIC